MIRWLRSLILAAALLSGLTPAQAQDFFTNVPSTGGGAPSSLGSYIYLETQTASASSQISFALDTYTGYSNFVIVFNNVLPTTDASELYMRTSTDGTSTCESGASDYEWNYLALAAAVGVSTGDNLDSEIQVAEAMGNVAGEGMRGELRIFSPSATNSIGATWHTGYFNSSSNTTVITGQGRRIASADVTDVCFLTDTSTIASGSFLLYGISTTSVPGPNEQITKLHVNQITATPSSSQNDYNPTGWDGTEPDKATHLRIAPTATIEITGLAGGTEGRIAILTNATTGTSGEMILLEEESASSTAANRFTFADGSPRFMMPGASIQLIYDATTSRWRSMGAAPLDARFDVWAELGGTGVETGVGVSGTGASCQAGNFLATDTTDAPRGVTQCDTGTTATGRAHLGSGSTQDTQPAKGPALFLTRLAIEAVSTNGVQEYQIWAGFHDAAGATSPADGVYFQYDVDVDTTWRMCTEDTSAQVCSTTDGPTVASTEYVWLGIFCPSDWIGCTGFYSQNGAAWTIYGTVSGENPPEVGDEVSVGDTINKTVGTTQSNLSIDVLAWRYDYDRGSFILEGDVPANDNLWFAEKAA